LAFYINGKYFICEIIDMEKEFKVELLFQSDVEVCTKEEQLMMKQIVK
jgi:hypothetical protein